MTKIDPRKYYNLREIQLQEIIPWAKGIKSLRQLVDADMITENRLKAIKKGSNTGTRYFIKGENIINYLVQVEDEGFQSEHPSKGVIKMDEEKELEEGNKEISDAQADDTANGVDKTDEAEGSGSETESNE